MLKPRKYSVYPVVQRAASMLEFSIVVPVLCLVVLGTIDLFTYLYLSNILEARAHRAMEVASWVPDLSKSADELEEGGDGENKSKLDIALDHIAKAAFDGEISRLFSVDIAGQRRAYLKEGDVDFFEKYIDSSNSADSNLFDGTENNKIAIILPSVDEASGNRDVGFSRQPIGIRINATIKPLTPFMPTISIKGEAWGFREDYSSASKLPMFDCLGRPFNPNNLPSPEDCNCGNAGINPQTGQCGCPPGKIWGIKPGNNQSECICDINQIYITDSSGSLILDGNNQPLNCTDGQLIDYDNCKCGAGCPAGGHPFWGQRRDEDNECSCKTRINFAGAPPGLVELTPGTLIIDSGTAKNGCSYLPEECQQVVGPAANGGFTLDGYTQIYYKCVYKSECAQNGTCPENATFSSWQCGCYCDGNQLVNPNGTCAPPPPCQWHVNEETGYSLLHWLGCEHYQCEDWTYGPSGWANMSEVVGEGCNVQYNGLENIPSTCSCQCKSGYYRNWISCCPIGQCLDNDTSQYRAEQPNEYTYVGASTNFPKACICKCKDGYVRENSGLCVAPEGETQE